MFAKRRFGKVILGMFAQNMRFVIERWSSLDHGDMLQIIKFTQKFLEEIQHPAQIARFFDRDNLPSSREKIGIKPSISPTVAWPRSTKPLSLR